MLQTDVIDLLQLHWAPADVIAKGRVLAAAREAQRAGQVRFIGASTYGEEAPLAALAAGGGYDTLQVAYNLADRMLDEQVLPLAQQQGVGIIVRSVLLRGVLTHRFALLPDQLAELRSAIAQLSRVADEEGCSLPEMAYRFVLANPAVSSALVGTARSEELEAALAFANGGPLTPTLITAIRQVAVSDRNQLNPGTWSADVGAWKGQTK